MTVADRVTQDLRFDLDPPVELVRYHEQEWRDTLAQQRRRVMINREESGASDAG